MRTFLEYVAEDIISKYGSDLAHTAVIFPNKRARLFFNEYLARQVEGTMWSPTYLTISELFRSHSRLTTADPIKLICDLHKSFVSVTGTKESLDHFYSWGQIMLADFDDIDKNMADAAQIFKNVGDIHELDDISYLSEDQLNMLKRFFSNFSENKSSELKRRFIELWSRFNDIYTDFNNRLYNQGLAYEGALYRKVANDDSISYDFDRYIFVGFNLLQRVEQKLFKRLKDAGKGFFYWDFDHYYMPGKSSRTTNEAGHYISSYLADFPNELNINDEAVYNNFSKPKSISYVAASTENIQAAYSSQWLKEGKRIADGRRTAIVMCNEGLLQALVHNIPTEVGKINITTGYPLAQSPFCSFLSSLISLRCEGYMESRKRYRLRFVNAVLRHPYMRYVSDLHSSLYEKINVTAKLFFPDEATLSLDKGLAILFGQLDTIEPTMSGKLLRWIMQLLKHVASNAKDIDDQFFKESLFKVYTIINRLYDLVSSSDLVVDVITIQRLLRQILQTTSIPFHGEPAVGVQFMGVLETRNIDFDHLLILSCNEGNMPKGVNDTSFIPYSIRKAHGLTTIDNKVAIYAYYFYRLLQRATDITVVYNNSSNGLVTGEMSRFMLQMLVESGHDIERLALSLPQEAGSTTCQDEKKTKEVMERLHKRFDKQRNPERTTPMFTPSSLNIYQKCPKRFYYRYVAEIIEPEDDADDGKIDAPTFGNIFHDAVQKIYDRVIDAYKSNTIQPQTLKQLLANDAYIKGVVDDIMHPVNGIQLINASVIITYIKQLLKIDSRLAPFTILGLENVVMKDINVKTAEGQLTTTIGGRIDRMDCVTCADGVRRIRVIDYKTGKNNKKNDGYILQSFIYSLLVDESPMNREKLEVSPALLYIQHSAGKDFDPTVVYEKEKVTDVSKYREEFMNTVEQIIAEIFNPEQPFACTDDKTACTHCPYCNLCGV